MSLSKYKMASLKDKHEAIVEEKPKAEKKPAKKVEKKVKKKK